MINNLMNCLSSDSISHAAESKSLSGRLKDCILILTPVCLFSVVLSALSLVRHYSFESFEDLAMFDQMLWNAWHGRGLVTTLSGNYLLMFKHHFFGEHFSPVLYLLAPLSGLSRGPEALLIFQAMIVALSAVPAALWARARLGAPRAAGWVAWLWLALPSLWLAVLYDFHMESLGPALFFMFLLALHRRSPWVWLWAALFAATKEDAPIYLAFTAIIAGWLSGRKRSGIILALAALCYFLLAWFWLIPAFSPTGKPLLSGRLLTPALCGGLTGWIEIVFFDPARWSALLKHLAGFGFLPLFCWPALVPAGAAMGVMWLSGAQVQNEILLHYPLSVYPLLFYAAIEGLRAILNWQQGRWPRAPRLLVPGMVAGLCLVGLSFQWLGVGNAWQAAMRTASRERVVSLDSARRALRAQVPPDAGVGASQNLLAHLARRASIAWFPSQADADFLALLTYSHTAPDHFYFSRLRSVLGEASAYGCLSLVDGRLLILQKGAGDRLAPAQVDGLTLVHECESLAHQSGRGVKDADAINGVAWLWTPDDRPGYIQYGPYQDLAPGRRLVTFRLSFSGPADRDWLLLDVAENDGSRTCGLARLKGASRGYTNVTVSADIASGQKVEFRCMAEAPGTVRLDRLSISE